jgi:hypothetical protein
MKTKLTLIEVVPVKKQWVKPEVEIISVESGTNPNQPEAITTFGATTPFFS